MSRQRRGSGRSDEEPDRDGQLYRPSRDAETIQESFGCGWSSEEQVAGEIRARYEQNGYLCDTHTAVAFHVAEQQKREGVPMVVLSTASPFKFPRSVLEALGHTAPQNDFEAMQELEAVTHHARARKPCGPAPESRALQHGHRPGADRAGGTELRELRHLQNREQE